MTVNFSKSRHRRAIALPIEIKPLTVSRNAKFYPNSDRVFLWVLSPRH
ncbi:hypothetical protein ACOKW7_24345 [Limnospira platensis CENA597]